MPITNGEMPSAFATFAAPSTNRSLDHASAASPATIITIDSQNGTSVYIEIYYTISAAIAPKGDTLPSGVVVRDKRRFIEEFSGTACL